MCTGAKGSRHNETKKKETPKGRTLKDSKRAV